ncbi:FKBP-type peptidyl-prolyl cis-trans isomerase [Flavobacterium urocaniciphilum]|uniref:peptidylprolyl isomerase n=1 Tax=Flavobacterium urocaniciphilum TaxID=1299341 RepID=A0A1H8YZF8_9FLAO|nr:hypothetical protein [Flavobacterium urocaniciphilum]SEP56748.1 hypothetical protein SAMN05444005_101330 [Flavobacterium urocaniciphilum]
MKFSSKLLLLLPFIFLMVGCPKDDSPTQEPARDYLEVYNEDIAEIEDFMDTHFMTVDGDYNVSFTEITPSTPGTAISDRSDLDFKIVNKNGVDHKLYFIKLREGIGENPTKLDSVFTSYKGFKTDLTSFDTAPNPIWLQLQDVIKGWQELFPEFKSGTSTTNMTTGITTYNDYGAGVMFVPSGLGYFNVAPTSIGGYTPIIFNFKLMNVRYKDHDGDKILSKEEYLGTGLVSGTAIDTDGDGNPDYADVDDDADGVITKKELRDRNLITPIPKDAKGYYIYSSIPTCGSGNKLHLNPSCQQ